MINSQARIDDKLFSEVDGVFFFCHLTICSLLAAQQHTLKGTEDSSSKDHKGFYEM